MRQDNEDFQLYEPASPMDPTFSAYQRHQQEYMAQTMGAFDMGFDAATAAAHQYGVYNTNNNSSRGSPGMGGAFDEPDLQIPSSNLSTTSAPSATSSAVGSPQSHHGQLASTIDWSQAAGLGVNPGIVGQGEYYPTGTEYSSFQPSMEEYSNAFDFQNAAAAAAAPLKGPGFVDPSLIHPDIARPTMADYNPAFAQTGFAASSPAASPQPQMMSRHESTSPYLANGHYPYSPYPPPDQQRSQSRGSFASPPYVQEHSFSDNESKEKQRCPHPDCGKTFKDLKAHMLTHQNERPEKCPIANCDYHVKGFARKYDKNRHTLTHYKGTMVCGFCPGSGSAAEKSFNRADVFKRHLTAVHGVEQTPPNSRKKTGGAGAGSAGKKLTGYPPDATGKCSTCTQTFSNAQDFYEHLDDCVLRIVQQEDPAEAINAKRLAEVEDDIEVHATLEKNQLPVTTQTVSTEEDGEDMEDDEDDVDGLKGGNRSGSSLSSPTKKNGVVKTGPVNGIQKSKGLTHSRGGVPLATGKRGRKNRRDYPSSWGFDKGQMTMKKRVMAVFDGPRRLAKDDMMLSTEHEVRVKLSDGKSYVTDLDVQTLRRAEGFLTATDEEKGPWYSDDPTEDDRKQMELNLELSTRAPSV